MSLTYGFALQPADDSADFANALRAVAGDGITPQGGRFAMSVNGFTVTVSSGYAFAAGRWVQNDEPLALSVRAAGNTGDRTDAIAVRVDYGERRAALEVLTGIDPAAIRADPAIVRNDLEYVVILYLIRVRRGATTLSPSDVTDVRTDGTLCGSVVPLSAVAGDVLRVYQFLTSGIDGEVARLIGLSEQLVQKADAAISELDEAIQKAGGGAEIGELRTARRAPAPAEEWLLCTGGRVSPEYPALSGLLGGRLPRVSTAADRYRTYIYGGPPQDASDAYYPYAPADGTEYVTPDGKIYCCLR